MAKVAREAMMGRRFGKLIVLSEAAPSLHGKSRWLCQCDCGKTRAIGQAELRNGDAKSCGCSKRRWDGRSCVIEYQSWCDMLKRCYRPTSQRYPHYGGRGIAVCDRWRLSFENFLADMGRKPTSSHTLDRINVHGNYEPGNCRWATRSEQMRNKQSTRLYPFRGKRRSLAEISELCGVEINALFKRIARGWSISRATTLPPQSRPVYYDFHGTRVTKTDLCRITGISVSTLRHRILKLGMSAEEAASIPSRRRRAA